MKSIRHSTTTAMGVTLVVLLTASGVRAETLRKPFIDTTTPPATAAVPTTAEQALAPLPTPMPSRVYAAPNMTPMTPPRAAAMEPASGDMPPEVIKTYKYNADTGVKLDDNGVPVGEAYESHSIDSDAPTLK